MSGIIIIIISALMLLISVWSSIVFYKLNNHVPFSEVEYIDYLVFALMSWLGIPASIFGIIAGLMILISG